MLLARQLRNRERELAGLYDRERESVERLVEADRIKSDFLSAVSHELRTPLTAIRGFALTLNRHWDMTPDATRRQQVAVIERQSSRLQRLVSDLLDFSTLEAGRAVVNPEPHQLRQLVEEAVASATAEGVSIDVAPGVGVLADRHRTEQILVNLLENAAKYGSPPVTVAAWPAAGQVTVTVEDQGPGVPGRAVRPRRPGAAPRGGPGAARGLPGRRPARWPRPEPRPPDDWDRWEPSGPGSASPCRVARPSPRWTPPPGDLTRIAFGAAPA